MKGVILAGGLGTRLYPLTKVTNKHLLPVYNKPMIYYPINTLIEAGITDILIVTGGNSAGDFLRLLGNGKDFGLKHLNYTYQEGEGGIADALLLAEHFAGGDKIVVILGDNIIEKSIKKEVEIFKRQKVGARILLKEVENPERFGVAEIKKGKIVRIIEKPKKPPSNLVVTGIYMYDNQVFDIIRTLEPSDRGELEITDVNNIYLKKGQLKEVADLLTQAYWNKGYITSFAYVPAQKIIDGVVEIRIVEGKVGKIKVRGNKYYKTKFIEKHFAAVKKEEVLNNKTLERGLLLLNDYPKLNVSATLTKGKEIGTTDIMVDVEEIWYPMNFTIFTNNYGSRYTGKFRTGLTWEWGNLTKNGDILSITGITTPKDVDDLIYYKVGYTLPLNGYGTKASISYSYMDYEVGKELANFGIEGESEIFTVGVSHPLIRARDKNLSWSASIKKKEFTNYLFEKLYRSSKDEYATLELGISGDCLKKKTHTYLTLKSTFGLGEAFGGMADEEYTNSSRPGLANGSWVKLNFDLTRIRQIGSCQLITRASGQWASDNLVTGEQFIIGGPDTVRAYPTGEYLGDYGYFVSAELRTPFLPGKTSLNKNINWAFFIDHGATYYNTVLPGEEKHHSLTGAGVGLRIYIPCHFHMSFDAGYPVSGSDPSDDDNIHYWFQAILKF